MADKPPKGRTARTRTAVKAPQPAAAAAAASNEPTVLDAEAFTHGGVPKAKFAPKVPARRLKKLSAVKKESEGNAEAEMSSELLKLVKQSKEDLARRGLGVDKKSAPVRVAFGFGGSAATSTARGAGFSRGFGSGGGGGGGGGGGSSFRGADKKTLIDDGMQGGGLGDGMTKRLGKEFVEPLDYSTYYPVTLPLRKPYSGKSELLDEEEFGEGSVNEFDEDTIVPAQELGLWNESEEDKILFFQLPASLPLGKLPGVQTTRVPESSDKGASSSGAQSTSAEETSVLGKLPAGFMGKLLVYESGAVKMQLGDILLDAVPGSECIFAQDVAAINSVTKHCCFLGDINKRVILVPDVDSLLGNTLEIG